MSDTNQFATSETNCTIQARRGPKTSLPTEAAQGEFLYCLDSHEMYMGMGLGVSPVPLAVTGTGDANSIQGIPVDPTPPADGEVLIYEGATGKYTPEFFPPADAKSIQGVAVDPGAPTDGEILIYNSAANEYVPSDPVVSGPDAPNSAPTKNPVQVGGIGDDGTVKRLASTNVGELKISAAALPLPAGGATSANQTSGNASLASIDTKTPALSGGKVPITDPVTLPLPAGAATSANQTSGNASLASIDTKTPPLSGGKVPITDPVTLPLPAGAATSANQTSGNASLASIDTKTPALSGGKVPVAATDNITGINGNPPALTNPLPVQLSDGTTGVGTAGNPLAVNVLSGGGSNPSVGATGATAPTSATEIGIVDGTGKLQGASASNPVPESVAQWGGAAVAAAASSSPTGSESGPVVRSIERKLVTVSTTTPLAANASYVSPWIDTQLSGGQFLVLQAISNQGSGIPGITIVGTNDITNASLYQNIGIWAGATSLTSGGLIANTLANIYAFCPFRYYRVTYLNGGTAQGTFSLSIMEQDMPPGLMMAANSGSSAQYANAFSGIPVGAEPVNGALHVTQALIGGPQAVDGALQAGAFTQTNTGYSVAFIPHFVTNNDQNNNNVRARTPVLFKTVQASASGSTALWTPTSGKKFRLMRFTVMVTANAAIAAGGVLTVKLFDGSTDLNLSVDVFIPSAAGTTMQGAFVSPWIDLGNGALSALANNTLNTNLSAALTSGNVRVVACGTEE